MTFLGFFFLQPSWNTKQCKQRGKCHRLNARPGACRTAVADQLGAFSYPQCNRNENYSRLLELRNQHDFFTMKTFFLIQEVPDLHIAQMEWFYIAKNNNNKKTIIDENAKANLSSFTIIKQFREENIKEQSKRTIRENKIRRNEACSKSSFYRQVRKIAGVLKKYKFMNMADWWDVILKISIHTSCEWHYSDGSNSHIRTQIWPLIKSVILM